MLGLNESLLVPNWLTEGFLDLTGAMQVVQ